MRYLKALFAVVILLAILAGVIWFGMAIVTWVLELRQEVAAAMVAGLAAVVILVLNQRSLKNREILASHRADKAGFYKQFVNRAVVELLRLIDSPKRKPMDEAKAQLQLAKIFLELNGDMIVWASPRVLATYAAFRLSKNEEQMVLLLEDLLRGIRTDLGTSNFGIERGDLIRLFLKDPEALGKLIEEYEDEDDD